MLDMADKQLKTGVFAENRRASFDYEILERFEAGMVLQGGEVKAIQNGKMNIAGSFVIFRGGVPYLMGSDLPPYQPINTPESYKADRARPLLLNKKEIAYLEGKIHDKKLTIVPLKVYNKNSRIKVELGLGRLRKKGDKREAIKKKEVRREIRETLLK